ncbi:hypothetical protein HYFRA_00008712 [Hymenoscyphus fraxineus]|uniref:Heterokaryon incompatibility domain-containing protein n=1 Tax=Hymenoscyphus fraxineus TaxID=746836 RepID=A0A9N9L1I3_9HELO|nr:hypothetical protein HYFRA_00008712 [Hymenoscyphus fraxineus]
MEAVGTIACVLSAIELSTQILKTFEEACDSGDDKYLPFRHVIKELKVVNSLVDESLKTLRNMGDENPLSQSSGVMKRDTRGMYSNLANKNYQQLTSSLASPLLKTYSILLRSNSKTKRRTLWTDAICIHQEDISNRYLQVKSMSAIYSSASGHLAPLETLEGYKEGWFPAQGPGGYYRDTCTKLLSTDSDNRGVSANLLPFDIERTGSDFVFIFRDGGNFLLDAYSPGINACKETKTINPAAVSGSFLARRRWALQETVLAQYIWTKTTAVGFRPLLRDLPCWIPITTGGIVSFGTGILQRSTRKVKRVTIDLLRSPRRLQIGLSIGFMPLVAANPVRQEAAHHQEGIGQTDFGEVYQATLRSWIFDKDFPHSPEGIMAGTSLCTLVIAAAYSARRHDRYQKSFLATGLFLSSAVGLVFGRNIKDLVFRYLFIGGCISMLISIYYHERCMEISPRDDQRLKHGSVREKANSGA